MSNVDIKGLNHQGRVVWSASTSRLLTWQVVCAVSKDDLDHASLTPGIIAVIRNIDRRWDMRTLCQKCLKGTRFRQRSGTKGQGHEVWVGRAPANSQQVVSKRGSSGTNLPRLFWSRHQGCQWKTKNRVLQQAPGNTWVSARHHITRDVMQIRLSAKQWSLARPPHDELDHLRVSGAVAGSVPPLACER